MNAIAALDLEPIKVKLMHKESGAGWTLERTNAVELEYRRFLTLMKKFPNEDTSPLVDVDTFWHYHILDTMKYAADCQAVFGYFLHHFPYVGMRGEDDAAILVGLGDRMKQLYEAEFGEAYGSVTGGADPAYCAMTPPGKVDAAAYCAMTPPGKVALTAYCAMTPPGKVDLTAYCAMTPPGKVGLAATLYVERPRLS